MAGCLKVRADATIDIYVLPDEAKCKCTGKSPLDMDGNCTRVGQCCVHHYPNGKGYTMKNGTRVIAWQPMPNFPDEFPHREFSKGALCPGDDD